MLSAKLPEVLALTPSISAETSVAPSRPTALGTSTPISKASAPPTLLSSSVYTTVSPASLTAGKTCVRAPSKIGALASKDAVLTNALEAPALFELLVCIMLVKVKPTANGAVLMIASTSYSITLPAGTSVKLLNESSIALVEVLSTKLLGLSPTLSLLLKVTSFPKFGSISATLSKDKGKKSVTVKLEISPEGTLTLNKKLIGSPGSKSEAPPEIVLLIEIGLTVRLALESSPHAEAPSVRPYCKSLLTFILSPANSDAEFCLKLCSTSTV